MACNKNSKLLNGLTLVELIVVFGIIGLIAVLIASPYFSFFRLFLNQFTAVDVASENRLALDEMTNQIRQSESVALSSTVCDGYSSGLTELVIQLWPLDTNGKPFQRGGYKDQIVYKRNPQDNTKLIKIICTDPTISFRKSGTKTVGADISNLQFVYNLSGPTDLTTSTKITVTITTSRVYDNKTQTTTQSADAFLRNK